MMKIYRRWDYDLIVSTVYGTADSIGISLNEKERYSIEQMVKRFCERTRSGENDSWLQEATMDIVVYDEGLELVTYLNLNAIDCFTVGKACGKFKMLYFGYNKNDISDEYKYYITIQ